MPITGTRLPFTATNVNNAPNLMGVYALYDGHTVIYYGRAQGGSVTLLSRLNDHHSGREGPCTQGASHFATEVTPYPVQRERQLLEEHYRTFGRLPRCNDRIG